MKSMRANACNIYEDQFYTILPNETSDFGRSKAPKTMPFPLQSKQIVIWVLVLAPGVLEGRASHRCHPPSEHPAGLPHRNVWGSAGHLVLERRWRTVLELFYWVGRCDSYRYVEAKRHPTGGATRSTTSSAGSCDLLSWVAGGGCFFTCEDAVFPGNKTSL